MYVDMKTKSAMKAHFDYLTPDRRRTPSARRMRRRAAASMRLRMMARAKPTTTATPLHDITNTINSNENNLQNFNANGEPSFGDTAAIAIATTSVITTTTATETSLQAPQAPRRRAIPRSRREMHRRLRHDKFDGTAAAMDFVDAARKIDEAAYEEAERFMGKHVTMDVNIEPRVAPSAVIMQSDDNQEGENNEIDEEAYTEGSVMEHSHA